MPEVLYKTESFFILFWMKQQVFPSFQISLHQQWEKQRKKGKKKTKRVEGNWIKKRGLFSLNILHFISWPYKLTRWKCSHLYYLSEQNLSFFSGYWKSCTLCFSLFYYSFWVFAKCLHSLQNIYKCLFFTNKAVNTQKK